MWEIPIKIPSNRHLVNKAHAHHVGDKWKEMKANLWQNDPAKASGKAIIWDNDSKPLAKWSGQGIQQSNHLGDKWKEMKANLWQNDPAKASGKAIIWDKWKEMKANLWQNDLAKASSQQRICEPWPIHTSADTLPDSPPLDLRTLAYTWSKNPYSWRYLGNKEKWAEEQSLCEVKGRPLKREDKRRQDMLQLYHIALA